MKKVLSVVFTLAVLFTFTGCSNTKAVANNMNKASEVSTFTISKDKSTNENNKNQTDSTKEAAPVKKMSTINITVNNITFTATLEDNDTAEALVKQLPLTVDMSELNGNEKYNYLSSNLGADKSFNPGTINEGDLMLYGNNCLVLFYKTFNTSYSYVKLGHIANTAGLAKAVGSGNVKVRFSISE